MKMSKGFIKSLLAAVYPNKCMCCGEIINDDNHLCNRCSEKIERIKSDSVCLNCGLSKADCVCKYNVYRFKKLICVFKNMGHARKVYYSYKFGKKQHYVNFLVEEMCTAIQENYCDIDFDYVCAVPDFKKFGYNHCKYIAKQLSQMLNIPFDERLLSCVKKRKKQHKSIFKERLQNVNGKYKYNYRVDGATILLVDDIKTTGATLDECAKTLLFAGADNVYCIAVLGTSMDSKQKN